MSEMQKPLAGLKVVELAPGVSMQDVKEKTEATIVA